MGRIVVSKKNVGVDFNKRIEFLYASSNKIKDKNYPKDAKKNKIYLAVGVGLLLPTKADSTYCLTDDLISYEYQKFTQGIKAQKDSLLNLFLEINFIPLDDFLSYDIEKVLITLQFTDNKILTVEMVFSVWEEFHEAYCVVTFPNYELEMQKLKESANNSIELARKKLLDENIEASEKLDIPASIEAIKKQMLDIDKNLKHLGKLAKKRGVEPLERYPSIKGTSSVKSSAKKSEDDNEELEV